MKKVKLFNVLVGMIILISIASCGKETQKVTATPEKTTPVVPKSGLIPFKETYVTQAPKSIITYSNVDIDSIYLLNNLKLVIKSELFSKNYYISGGAVYVINSDLVNLNVIPELSIGRVKIGKIERDGSGWVNNILVVFDFPDKEIKYLFWASRESDGSFMFNQSTPGTINYKREVYPATIETSCTLLYNLFETDKRLKDISP